MLSVVSKLFPFTKNKVNMARPLFEKSASSSSTNHRPPSTPTAVAGLFGAPQSLSPTSRGHSRRPAETTHSHRPALQQPARLQHTDTSSCEPNDAARRKRLIVRTDFAMTSCGYSRSLKYRDYPKKVHHRVPDPNLVPIP
ncbi:unnamed protein product, partial [Trichogramma brassicae]